MSYMRAWKLLQTMNSCFREPLVDTARGGAGHGKATLTATGRAALTLYRRMESEDCAGDRARLAGAAGASGGLIPVIRATPLSLTRYNRDC